MIGDLETSCLSLLSRLINYAPLELLIRIRSEAYLAEGISSIIFEISLDLFGAFQLFRRRHISIYFYRISTFFHTYGMDRSPYILFLPSLNPYGITISPEAYLKKLSFWYLLTFSPQAYFNIFLWYFSILPYLWHGEKS